MDLVVFFYSMFATAYAWHNFTSAFDSSDPFWVALLGGAISIVLGSVWPLWVVLAIFRKLDA